MYKKNAMIIPVFLLIFLAISPVFAEGSQTLSIKDITVQIMPENDVPQKWPADTPSVLIGYYATMVNDTGKDFKGPITFSVPTDAPNFVINMVCETEQGMLCQPYEINEKEKTVSFIPSRVIKPGEEFPVMVEFFTNPIQGDTTKTFSYTFSQQYKIPVLNVDIVKPLRADNFQVSPKETKTLDVNGEMYYKYYLNDVEPNQEFTYTVSYVKKDNLPTKKIKETVQMNETSSAQPIPQSKNKNFSTGFVIIAISILVFGFLLYLGLKNKQAVPVNGKDLKVQKSSKSHASLEKEKKKLRKMLLDGKIDESTYQKMMKNLKKSR
ncbi:hypothetical protein L1765_14420 [Microaerobacter geothermalis]|uniref:hypothetical protein n=1 Tax=Microaerobacter geothermalis TaxID=674972 RepID=UPI001F303CDD|nr:hypothetical protein [Microaerobacter geothermalis]MCF6095155.1 hypothetical protein [Microaerobacter geothermalis]